MSTNEMERKARELRQLQALIEEAQQEAEALKDAIKAAMGDAEATPPESIKSPGSPSQAPASTPPPCARPCRMWPQRSPKKPPFGGSAWPDGPQCARIGHTARRLLPPGVGLVLLIF